GLVGEGDAEDLLGWCPVLHQLANIEGDGGGLARPGAGGDARGAVAVGEDRRLLRSGRDHRYASLPSGHAGHTSRNWHRSQWAPTVGVQSSSRIPVATSSSVWRTSSRFSISKGKILWRSARGYHSSAATGRP